MQKSADIPVIHYTTDHVPDDRPGKPATSARWELVWEAIHDMCAQHGLVGPYNAADYDELVYWVVDDQYNDERYQYVEICKPEGMHAAWLRDLMKLLKRFPNWGAGIVSIGGGYLLVFSDRLMVTGPAFAGAATFDDVVRCTRRSLDLQDLVNKARDDADVEELTCIPELREGPLVLRELNQVTDGGLQFIALLRGTTWLNLSDSYVTDRGLVHLKTLDQMNDLGLSNTPVTGAGLVHLLELASLREISVRGCPLSEAGYRAIARFVNLEMLDLSETRTTDADLSLFEGHQKLRKLYIQDTQISAAALDRFRKAVPTCEIVGPECANRKRIHRPDSDSTTKTNPRKTRKRKPRQD